MADSSQVRRILYMHPAHRTVGVSGIASSFRACPPIARPSADQPAVAPARVSLVSCMTDRRSAAAMTAFEQIMGGRGAQCNRVDLASVEKTGLGNVDCAVVFDRGLQIIGRWSEFDGDIIGENGVEEDEGFEVEIEVAAAARRHPVVDGIGPFIARHRASHPAYLCQNLTQLLVRKWAGRAFPVAWARQGDGRAFYTSLGHPEDFRRREFRRLLLNAIEWARDGG